MDNLLTLLLEVLGTAFIIVGVIFSALGVLGILRLPDTFSRLHASGKTGSLGVVGLCIGVGLLMPETIFKVLSLAIFIIFSGPVSSHAIAAAVHRSTRLGALAGSEYEMDAEERRLQSQDELDDAEHITEDAGEPTPEETMDDDSDTVEPVRDNP